MNEQLIMDIIRPIMKNTQITYKDFNQAFNFLSKNEQYAICNLLEGKGIHIVDHIIEKVDVSYNLNREDGEFIDIDEFGDLLEYIEDEEDDEYNQFDNDNLFQDSNDFEYEFTYKGKINQSNETLCVLIQEENELAKRDLCQKNERLVIKYAYAYQHYFGNKLDVEELIQEGYIGLLEAADRFDTRMGNMFSTYAVFWIRQRIARCVINDGFLIRIPVHMMERISKVSSLDNYYGMFESDFDKRVKLIAEEMFIDPLSVEEALKYRNQYLKYFSLNVPVGEEDDIELLDLFEDTKAVSVEKSVENNLLRDELNDVLLELTDREEKVLRLRFGLDDGRTRTLEEIGREFNVTRERIRQIEAKALRKLKHPSRSKRLKDFLER